MLSCSPTRMNMYKKFPGANPRCFRARLSAHMVDQKWTSITDGMLMSEGHTHMWSASMPELGDSSSVVR